MTSNQSIILTQSEYESLLKDILILKERVARLTALRDDLVYHICPSLRSEYEEKIASLERELLAAQLYLMNLVATGISYPLHDLCMSETSSCFCTFIIFIRFHGIKYANTGISHCEHRKIQIKKHGISYCERGDIGTVPLFPPKYINAKYLFDK